MNTTPESKPEYLTVDRAIELLERAVNEKGADYVYKRSDRQCVYTDPDTGDPSCMVGYVLTWAGYQIPQQSEGKEADVVICELEAGDADAAEVLATAQVCQDAKGTWGNALLEARKAASEVKRENTQ